MPRRNNIIFTCSLDDFEIFSKVRMTGPGKWSKRARRQLDNQSALATWFKMAYSGGGDREPINEPCILSFAVHLPHRRRVDVDNIQKAIQDALQYGGVIEDDYLIRGTDSTRLWQKSKGPARICVTLKKLDEEHPLFK